MENMETEKKQIKEIFSQLDKMGKDEVRNKISAKYKITVDVAKNHWIYGGNIPVEKIKGVLSITKAVMKKQVEKMQNLIA